MWARVNQEWEKLPDLLQQKETIYNPSFKELEKDENLKNLYNKSIDGYSHQDLSYLVHWKCWQNHKRVCGLGRSSFFLVKSLLEKYPHLEGESFEKFSSIIDFRKIDAILCPRFFHYFPDNDALKILNTLRDFLERDATLYVMEMLLDDSTPKGGLFDLNMFVETGGKVRTLEEWSQMFLKSSFTIDEITIVSPILTVLRVKKS